LPVLDPPAGIVVGMGFVMVVCPDIMGTPLVTVNARCYEFCGCPIRFLT